MLRGVRALLAIRDPHATTVAQAEAAFRRRLDGAGLLRHDGHLGHATGAAQLGRYEFVDASADAAAWPAPIGAVGVVRAMLQWEWWSSDHSLLREWLKDVGRAARGVFVTGDGVRFELVKSLSFPIEEAFQRYGFREGTVFFLSDEPYMAYVRGTISQQLARAGAPSQLITYGTGHNPIRVSDDAVAAPHGARLHVVGFDWSVFDDPQFEQQIVK